MVKEWEGGSFQGGRRRSNEIEAGGRGQKQKWTVRSTDVR